MDHLTPRRPPPRILERIALTGLALATVALGALAVWSAVVTRDSASGLSQAGLQTSAHLLAVQALIKLDAETDVLGEDFAPYGLARLVRVHGVFDRSLDRMERGGIVEARRIARTAQSRSQELQASIDGLLAARRTGDPKRLEAADDATDRIVDALQVLLNDRAADPTQLLNAKLASVNGLERTVRRTTLMLVPLGLGLVLVCGWLLRSYRRRSEATMGEALELSSREARTDQLTGLANRRALLEELERRMQSEEPFTLALADLDGFKQYNDTYGHAAGDALLSRLGSRLQASSAPRHGMAARLGGDEFCVLFPATAASEEIEKIVTDALGEEGKGFRITAGCGVVRVPEEAATSEAALRLADVRMYAAKAITHPTDEHVMSRVLVQMLEERHPGLSDHVEEVAELAAACAKELGLDEEEAQHVRRAAELHDIGKLAIPESIVHKPAPLSDAEWDFMRRHTIIGERVLGLMPSLTRAAALVRASHERWDGTGYPDRLAGDEIPVGARIVSVADAFAAMTNERPYAAVRSVEDALAELRACAGTQFDPVAVAAFAAVLAAARRIELAA